MEQHADPERTPVFPAIRAEATGRVKASGRAKARSMSALHVPENIRDDLLLLQHARISALTPLFYLSAALIAIFAAMSWRGNFSLFYVVAGPVFFMSLGIVRGFIWYRRRDIPVNPQTVRHRLFATAAIGLVIGFVGSMWTIDAYYQTGEARRVLVPIYLFMICWVGVVCVAVTPRIAITIMVVTQAGPLVAMSMTSDPGIQAMAFCFTIISLMLAGMIVHNFSQIIDGLKLKHDLKILSETDPLTGLANRRAFEDSFKQLQSASQTGIENDLPADSHVHLALIDLDHFKQVNDRFGHLAGDAMLQEVASRLVSLCPDAVCIARMGGDEFAVLEVASPSEMGGDKHSQARMTKMREGLSRSYRYEADILAVGASIGTARSAIAGCSLRELVKTADTALYEDKQRKATYDDKRQYLCA